MPCLQGAQAQDEIWRTRHCANGDRRQGLLLKIAISCFEINLILRRRVPWQAEKYSHRRANGHSCPKTKKKTLFFGNLFHVWPLVKVYAQVT